VQVTSQIDVSTLKNSDGQAFLIFPGGGYRNWPYDWEGTRFCKIAERPGIAGIVNVHIVYPSQNHKQKYNKGTLQDAQRALRDGRSKQQNGIN